MEMLIFYLVCAVVFITDPQNKEFIKKLKEVEE